MKYLSYVWTTPLIVWLLCLISLLMMLCCQKSGEVKVTEETPLVGSSVQRITPPLADMTPEPGLTVVYKAETNDWRWRYVRLMNTGCEKLLLSDHPVTVDDKDMVTITLKTYLVDEKCEKPPITTMIDGHIAGDAAMKFQVMVDDKLATN